MRMVFMHLCFVHNNVQNLYAVMYEEQIHKDNSTNKPLLKLFENIHRVQSVMSVAYVLAFGIWQQKSRSVLSTGSQVAVLFGVDTTSRPVVTATDFYIQQKTRRRKGYRNTANLSLHYSSLFTSFFANKTGIIPNYNSF